MKSAHVVTGTCRNRQRAANANSEVGNRQNFKLRSRTTSVCWVRGVSWLPITSCTCRGSCISLVTRHQPRGPGDCLDKCTTTSSTRSFSSPTTQKKLHAHAHTRLKVRNLSTPRRLSSPTQTAPFYASPFWQGSSPRQKAPTPYQLFARIPPT